MLIYRSAYSLWGHMFNSAMDQIRCRGIRDDELPQSLIDRSMFFAYYTSLVNADYSCKTSIEQVHSLLIALKHDWMIRSEENIISEDQWDNEIDGTLCAMGMCVIVEFFKFKSALTPKTMNEITIPRNFNPTAYIKAINTIFADSNDDASKKKFLSIVYQEDVSKKKLLNILISNSIDEFRDKRTEFIMKVSSLILPKPEIKIIYTNKNLTATMANMNTEEPKVPSSSKSKNVIHSNIQKLLAIEDNDIADNCLFDDNNNYNDDEEEDDDEEEKGKNFKPFSKTKDANISSKKLQSSRVAQSKGDSKLIGKVLLHSSTSKSKEKSTNDIITNLSEAHSKMSGYSGKDPLLDITNTKRPNSGNKSDSNEQKSKRGSNVAGVKKPKLTDTRPDATKVAFDSDDEIVTESDDDDVRDSKSKYGIDTSKINLNFQNFGFKSSNIELTGSSKFPKTLKGTSKVESPRISNRHKKTVEKSQTGLRKFWTFDEEEAFKAGMKKHGIGNWQTILDDVKFGEVLSGRTGMNLKDKYKNMIKKNPNFM